MNTIEQDIEKYLNGEMTQDETTIFLQLIEQNQKAKELLGSYIEMNAMYDETDWSLIDKKNKYKKVKGYTDFLVSDKGKKIADKIKQSEKDYFSNESFGLKNMYRNAIAIAAILVIGLFLVYQSTTSIDNERLYAEYKDWNILPSLTLRDGITDVSKVEALFKTEKYEESLVFIDKISSNNEGDLDFQLLFYKGVILLEIDNTAEAFITFNKILNEDTLDGAKAHWYIALTYLKENNIDKAKDELIQLLNTTSFQKVNAERLLKEL